VLLNVKHLFSNISSPRPPFDTSLDGAGTSETELSGSEDGEASVEAGPSGHPDEPQVLLDTRRAFVAYPKGMESFLQSLFVAEGVGLPAEEKLEMQADLQDLIVGVLRKYPNLSYFQVSEYHVLRD